MQKIILLMMFVFIPSLNIANAIVIDSDSKEINYKGPLTLNLKNKENQWNVTENDNERYINLLDEVRGSLSPDLDPISLLGIEARNDAERRITQNHERGR